MFRPFGRARRQLTGYNEDLLADRLLIDDGDEEADLFQDRSQVEYEEEGEADMDATLQGTCRPANSLWALCSYTLLLGVYFVALFVPWGLIFLGIRNYQDTAELPVKISLHVLLLPMAIALKGALLLQHETHACMEYLQFYRDVQRLVSLPHILSSATNAVILLSSQWPMQGYLHTDIGETHLLQIIVGAELTLMLIFCVVYMRHVTLLYGYSAPLHSQLRPIQSLLPEEFLVGPSQRGSGGSRGLPPRRGLGAITPEIAELVLYMSRQITWLGRDVMHLEKRLALRNELAGADPPQAASADVQNLLQAREQQLRALMVEQQGLQKQQSIAWKMLDERDAENSRLQINRQQYMDENNRLRATLREWSHRNAKLEQKLTQMAAELDASRAVDSSSPHSSSGIGGNSGM